MENSWRVGTIGGIQISIHPSWLFALFLVAWTLAAGLFPQQYAGLDATTYWVMGFSASLLLFLSVLIHELAHSFVAIARGLPVKNITLFIFGGVSNIAREARSSSDELVVAIVGPVSSLILAGLFWALSMFLSPDSAITGVVSYLAGINVILAVFNMIPGFPLDGGRVLRAALWGATGNLQRSTRIAAVIGNAIGYLFIFGGIYMALTGSLLSGLWLAFIGWFLSSAAQSANQQSEIQARLQGVSVARLMNPQPETIEPGTRLSEVVDGHILHHAVRALPVVEADGRLVGMLTLQEIRNTPREEWDSTPARFAMIKIPDLHTVAPNTSLKDALGIMAEHDVNQLPVVRDGLLAGLLSRDNVIRFLQVQEELGIDEPDARRDDRRRAA